MEKMYYSSLENFLFIVAGTDRELLDKGELTEADESKQKQFGAFMILSVLLFSANVFFLTSIFLTIQIATGLAIVAALGIIYLERTMFHYKELSSLLPRVVMVAASAFFLSSGMSFYIQKDKIKTAIINETSVSNAPLDSIMYFTMDAHNKAMAALTTDFDEQISSLKQRELDAVGAMELQPLDQLGRKNWSSVNTTRRTLKSTIADREMKVKELADRQKKEITDLKAVLEPQRRKAIVTNEAIFDRYQNSERDGTDSFLMWLLFLLEVMPCLLRFSAQKSDYLAIVSAKKATKRKDAMRSRRVMQQEQVAATQHQTNFSTNGQQAEAPRPAAPAFDYDN